MKTCKKCKEEFDEPYVTCSPCRKKHADYAREWLRKNRDRRNAERRKHRKENPKIPKSYTKDCKLCGETFTTGNVRGSHQYKYCNDCNAKEYHRRWYLKNYTPVKPKEIECPTCKTVFINKRSSKGYGGNKMYCNPQCRPQKVKARELREKQIREGKDCQWCGKHISFENVTETRLRMFKTVKFCSNKCTTAHRLSSPQNKLAARYRSEMWRILKDLNEDKAKSTFDILGYSYTELTSHIGGRFSQPKWNGYEWVDNSKEYSWDNMDDWHIDHIRPVSSFNFTTTDCEDFKKCWALNNLQPLWAKDNMSKGDKWDGEVNA